jgi:aspartate ammonia-lyase
MFQYLLDFCVVKQSYQHDNPLQHLSVMSSTSPALPAILKYGDEEITVPKFGARIEELAKQYNEKNSKFEVISDSIKTLLSERDDIRTMLDTITNQGLFNTALEVLDECMRKLESQVVSTNSEEGQQS